MGHRRLIPLLDFEEKPLNGNDRRYHSTLCKPRLEIAMNRVFSITTYLLSVSFYLLVSGTVCAEWSYTIDFESNLSDGTAPADGQIEDAGYESTGYVAARFWSYYSFGAGDSLAELQSKFPLDGDTTGLSHNHWVLRSSSGPDLHSGDGYLEFASGYETQAGDWVGAIFKNTLANVMTLEKGASADFIDRVTGQIWDIDTDDGIEKFNVYAHDATGAMIASDSSPVGIAEGSSGSLHGKPWTFELQVANDGSQDIAYVSIFRAGQNDQTGLIQNYDYDATYVSNLNANYIGTSFWLDNLTISQTPEPSSLLVFGGLISLAVLRRRRRPRSLADHSRVQAAV